MKLGNRMPVDVGIVLAAGAAMAPTTELVGSTLGATTLAAFSAPAAAAGAPEPIGDHSAPSPAVRVAERSVAEHSVPISAYSPPVHCVDIPMPGIVGSASAPHCVVFRTPETPETARTPVREAIADHSVPLAAPVADSSAPRCVETADPTTTVRRC